MAEPGRALSSPLSPRAGLVLPGLGLRSPVQGRVGGHGGPLARGCSLLAGLGFTGTQIGEAGGHVTAPSPNTHRYTHSKASWAGFLKVRLDPSISAGGLGRHPARCSEAGTQQLPGRPQLHRARPCGPPGGRTCRSRAVGRLLKNNAASQPLGSHFKRETPTAALAPPRAGCVWLSLGAAHIPAPGGASYLWSEQAPGDGISVPATLHVLPGRGWRQPLKVNLRINGYFKRRLISAVRGQLGLPRGRSPSS